MLSQLLQEDGDPPVNESLSIENTLWASTVVASGKYLTDGVAVQEVNRTSSFALNLGSVAFLLTCQLV